MEAREENDDDEAADDEREDTTEVFYMEDDDMEEIETLEEEVGEENEEMAEEDVEEETILTGKFRNIRGYQERVRRLSDEVEDRTPPPTVTVVVYDDPSLAGAQEQEEEEEEEEEVEEVVDESVSGQELASHLSELQVEDVGVQVDEAPSGEDAATRSSSEETDPERVEDFKMRIKRSSSLKCGKTPPGTPGRKKIVRFADMLGLDLAAVRTFLGGGVPHVPRSAFWDLQVERGNTATGSGSPPGLSLPCAPRRVLTPLFQQPGEQHNFLERVRHQRVVVEAVHVGGDMSVRGSVRVLSLDFHKTVTVRYTFDRWRNFHEATASYVPDSYDGLTDRFSFLLWGSFLQDNGALIFCVRYQTLGQEFWDNNFGRDYSLQCYTLSGAAGEKGPDGTARPQNSSSVQQHYDSDVCGAGGSSRGQHQGDQMHHHNYHTFGIDSPTTPNDPWVTTFF